MTTEASLTYLRAFVRRRSAIVIEDTKDYLLEARLAPVAKAAQVASLDELVKVLREQPEGALHTRVVEAMTTNETSFFRDVHPFDTLRKAVLPQLIADRAPSKTLRIWCGAASTGQEPYSIALTIREHFPELASWRVQIVATDLNLEVLERARSGVYRQLEVNRGLPASLLVKHFERVGADWRLKPEIRSMVRFEAMNLLDRWPLFGAQDIVFMRNVLIYFDLPTKRNILRRVRENLRPDGALFLGGAETTLNIDDGFETVRTAASAFYRPCEERKVLHAAR